MESNRKRWTKSELKTYILLLCANADDVESAEEIDFIKTKTDIVTFENIYNEFTKDSEDERFEKIDDCIQLHEFSNLELANFRNEIYKLFKTDHKIDLKERNLDRILDNILY